MFPRILGSRIIPYFGGRIPVENEMVDHLDMIFICFSDGRWSDVHISLLVPL